MDKWKQYLPKPESEKGVPLSLTFYYGSDYGNDAYKTKY